MSERRELESAEAKSAGRKRSVSRKAPLARNLADTTFVSTRLKPPTALAVQVSFLP